MLSQEDLQAISQLVKNEVEPINQRLDKMDNRFDGIDNRLDGIDSRLDKLEEAAEELKEDTEITRDVTNSIGKWIEYYFGKDKPFPIDEDEIENQDKILKMID